jgi:hypothetical protein
MSEGSARIESLTNDEIDRFFEWKVGK